ncbi:MAG: hypothetical protein PHU25_00815 [Deltaproteobacteria bacterium]|nr:hypothetical protein [Deltaproteobacteria bacterium]
MSAEKPLPLLRQTDDGDYYRELIEGSRWLHKEQAQARTAWFENLPWEHKEKTLFTFEMLLKGFVCYGNPMNHAGPSRRGEPLSTRDFKIELMVARAAALRVSESGHVLLGGDGRARVFQRYLSSVLSQDGARVKLVKKSLDQDTPEQSLKLLCDAFENLAEVGDGLARTGNASYKLFSSFVQLGEREIHRSSYFDPLAALEFRAEFDRLKSVEVLDVLRRIPIDPARRVAALTFLALFRLLRYLDLVTEEAREPEGHLTVYALLAVFRSDARALQIFLRREVAAWISTGFGKIFEHMDASFLEDAYPDITAGFEKLKSLRQVLGSMGNQLRMEQRKVYEQQLPMVGAAESPEAFVDALTGSVQALRGFLQSSVLLLASEFDSEIDGDALFESYASLHLRSESLRRDIWMFQQILRAFIAKAKGSANAADQWAGLNTFRFVREFVGYFKSMGYQLLRHSDYEEFDKFMGLVDRLRDGDVLEVQRLHHVIETCESFQAFLEQTFEGIGLRQELKGVPFDRKDAARTLMLYLGH